MEVPEHKLDRFMLMWEHTYGYKITREEARQYANLLLQTLVVLYELQICDRKPEEQDISF